ncbi:fimbrial protein [Paraburkholderia fungorum]|uniref:fimbrial protein n=1 Tax=Paraburkholderia fungorum TaxID=134537 RepID=UPI0038B90695
MLLASIFFGVVCGGERKSRTLFGIAALCFGVLMLVSSPAEAACTFKNLNYGELSAGTINGLTIPSNAPVGAVLATMRSTIGRPIISCDAAGGVVGLSVPSKHQGLAYVPNMIEPTDTPGIGYTVKVSGVINGDWTQRFNVKSFSGNLTVTLQLIKTGPITLSSSGSVYPSPNSGINWTAVYTDGGDEYGILTSGAIWMQGAISAASLSSSSCTTTTPSVTVPLPTTTVGQLNRMDPSAGLKAFNIGVKCDQLGTKVRMTMTDNTNPSNRSNQLSLSSGSTATGLQLQILNNGTPIQFGADSAVQNNPGSFDIGTSSGAEINVPLSVRYIKTGTVSAGSVNALATFTLNYQ